MRQASLETRKSIVTEIVSRFATLGPKENGKKLIRWQEAFDAHPEWKTVLQWDQPKKQRMNQQLGYWVLKQMKKNGHAPNGKGSEVIATRPVTKEALMLAISESVEPPPRSLQNFCYHCGADLITVHDVLAKKFTVEQRHAFAQIQQQATRLLAQVEAGA